ncbi:hypothetical protein GCM10009785_00010 [Brooklawnia cerclae]
MRFVTLDALLAHLATFEEHVTPDCVIPTNREPVPDCPRCGCPMVGRPWRCPMCEASRDWD